MKLVFCGTPEFAVPSLQALVDAGHEIPLVLTQPDRPAGRKQELQLPPVKQLAMKLNLPVLQPERLKNNPELRALLESIAPDAIIVVAYGRIIPQWMLDLPPLRQHQRPRLAPPQIPRRRPHPVGRRQRRNRNRRHHHAPRRWPRHRKYTAFPEPSHRPRHHLSRALSTTFADRRKPLTPNPFRPGAWNDHPPAPGQRRRHASPHPHPRRRPPRPCPPHRPAKPTIAGEASPPGPAPTPSFAASASSSTACTPQPSTSALAPQSTRLFHRPAPRRRRPEHRPRPRRSPARRQAPHARPPIRAETSSSTQPKRSSND